MLYLVLTTLCGALVTIALRYAEGHFSSKTGMLAMNYLTCFIGVGAFVGHGNILPGVTGGIPGVTAADGLLTVGLGALSGFLYMAALLLLQYNVEKSGVILASVFQKLGLMVTVIGSILFFGEEPGVMQFGGLVFAIAGIILINYEKGHLRNAFKPMLLILLVVDGCGMGMLKVYNEVGVPELEDHFLFFNFFFACLFCLIETAWKREKISGRDVLHGISIGAPNFLASRFLLMALETVPAIIAYPTRGVAVIVCVSIAGIFLFKEHLVKRQWIAMALVMTAIVLLNV